MRFKERIILVIYSLFLLAACRSAAQQTNLSVSEFEQAIKQENIQVLDVRTPEEYESGHLKNALLANWNDEVEFKSRAGALDKTRPVYTYCLSGARSNAATRWLRENGFTAYNLSGGINAWKKAGKVVEQTGHIKQITFAEYIAMIPQNKTVLVDISAVWCPPCKKMAPIVDSLVASHREEFILLKIDGSEQSSISRELNVTGFPTFIIYKQGKEVWRKEGITELREFEVRL